MCLIYFVFNLTFMKKKSLSVKLKNYEFICRTCSYPISNEDANNNWHVTSLFLDNESRFIYLSWFT